MAVTYRSGSHGTNVPFGQLIWDDENEEHFALHGVTPEEIAETFYSSSVIVRSRSDTYRMNGQTNGGRFLCIIVARRPHGQRYVVTARDADDLERRIVRRS